MRNKNLALNAIFKFAAKSFRLQQCCVLFSIVVVGSELREQKQAIKIQSRPNFDDDIIVSSLPECNLLLALICRCVCEWKLV